MVGSGGLEDGGGDPEEPIFRRFLYGMVLFFRLVLFCTSILRRFLRLVVRAR